MNPETSREQLQQLLQRDTTLRFDPQAPGEQDKGARSSAVLILFGALDRVPASSAVQTVHPALDVLLIRRSNALRHHAGQIAFPGGGQEENDADLGETALREAEEETGLDPAGVELLGKLHEIYVPVSRFLVTPVIGWWAAPSPVEADHSESVDVFRIPVAELLDPAARGVSVLRRGGRTYRAPAFRLGQDHGGHIVWGFTGMILASLFDELGWSVPWSNEQEFLV